MKSILYRYVKSKVDPSCGFCLWCDSSSPSCEEPSADGWDHWELKGVMGDERPLCGELPDFLFWRSPQRGVCEFIFTCHPVVRVVPDRHLYEARMWDAYPLTKFSKVCRKMPYMSYTTSGTKQQQSVLGLVLHLKKKTDYSSSMGPLSWPLLFESPHCDKSPRARCHELTQTAATHMRTPPASLPPSITHSSSCLRSLCSLCSSSLSSCFNFPTCCQRGRRWRGHSNPEDIPLSFQWAFSSLGVTVWSSRVQKKQNEQEKGKKIKALK